MRSSAVVLSAVLGLFASLPLAAADTPLAFAEIREQQIEIRADVAANKPPYDDMAKRDRERLVQRQDALLRLIDGKETLLDLDESGRTEAINSLEWIRAEIHDAEENRMICKRELPVGSHMKKRVCKTVAERRKEREEAMRAWPQGSRCSSGIGCE
jgi:hypothetical protein